MRVIWSMVSHSSKWFAFDLTRSSKWLRFETFCPQGDEEEPDNRSTGFTLDLLTFGMAMEWWNDQEET